MNDQELSLWLAIPLIMVIFWSLVIGLIGPLSGWQRLAQRYRATLPPAGRSWHWQDGTIGWTGYSGILTLTASTEGLFMEVFFPFGIGHPRLFIPWHEFHQAERKNILWRRQVQVKVGFPPQATLRLPAAVFEESEGHRLLPET